MSDNDFSILNVDDFNIENEDNTRKRSSPSDLQVINHKRLDESTEIKNPQPSPSTSTISVQSNENNIQPNDVYSRWFNVRMHFINKHIMSDKNTENTSLIEIKENKFRRTGTLLLQIDSVRKTETGYYCEFSDPSGRIFGTLNNEIIKKYQRIIEVSTILLVRNVPILHVTVTNNIYLIMSADNIIRVVSKYDDIST